jgi:guanylate kinase
VNKVVALFSPLLLLPLFIIMVVTAFHAKVIFFGRSGRPDPDSRLTGTPLALRNRYYVVGQHHHSRPSEVRPLICPERDFDHRGIASEIRAMVIVGPVENWSILNNALSIVWHDPADFYMGHCDAGPYLSSNPAVKIDTRLEALGRIPVKLQDCLPSALVLYGPPSSGKTTIGHRLLERHPGTFGRVLAYTTRPPRSEEVDGEHYHFVTNEVFDEMGRLGKILCHTRLHHSGGYVYWVSVDSLTEMMGRGKIPILVLGMYGVQILSSRVPLADHLYGAKVVMLDGVHSELCDRISARASGTKLARMIALIFEQTNEYLANKHLFAARILNANGGMEAALGELETIMGV